MTKLRQNQRELAAWRAAQEKIFREHGLVRTLEDMTEEEIQEIEQKYGMPVIRPTKEDRDGTV